MFTLDVHMVGDESLEDVRMALVGKIHELGFSIEDPSSGTIQAYRMSDTAILHRLLSEGSEDPDA